MTVTWAKGELIRILVNPAHTPMDETQRKYAAAVLREIAEEFDKGEHNGYNGTFTIHKWTPSSGPRSR